MGRGRGRGRGREREREKVGWVAMPPKRGDDNNKEGNDDNVNDDE